VKTLDKIQDFAVISRKSNVQDVSAEAKSITRQKEHAIAWGEAEGWRINSDLHVYEDDAVCGAEFSPEKRPGLARFLRDIGVTDEHDSFKFGKVSKRRPPFQALVLMAEDRLGRDMFNMPFVMKQIIDRGIRVFDYVTGREIRLDTFEGKATLAVKSLVADGERSQARARASDTRRAKFHAGNVTGGFVYGYVNVAYYGHGACAGHVEPGPKRGDLDKIVRARQSQPWCPIEVAHGAKRDRVVRIIDPIEAAVVIRIFILFRNGWGVKSIAKLLNAEGVPSPTGRAAWSKDTVYDILHRSEYRGIATDFVTRRTYVNGSVGPKMPGEPEQRPAEHLRIVPDSLWNEVRARCAAAKDLRDTQGRLLGKADKHSEVLLSGLVRCRACGHAITRKRMPGGREVYVCSYRNARGTAACSNGAYPTKAAVDGAVLDVFAGTILNLDRIEAALDEVVVQIDTDPAEIAAQQGQASADLRKIEVEIENLVSLAASSGSGALLDGIKARERQKADLLAKIEHLDGLSKVPTLDRAALRASLRGLLDDWKGLLLSEPAVARQIVKKLLVGLITLNEDGTFTGEATYDKLVPVHTVEEPPSETSPQTSLRRQSRRSKAERFHVGRRATHEDSHGPALNVPVRARALPAQPVPGGGLGGGRRGPLRRNAADGPFSSL